MTLLQISLVRKTTQKQQLKNKQKEIMVKKYKTKSYIIQAIQFVGNNDKQCLQFCPKGRDPNDIKANLIIPTLTGEVLCSVGDYIVKPFLLRELQCCVVYTQSEFNMTFEQVVQELNQNIINYEKQTDYSHLNIAYIKSQNYDKLGGDLYSFISNGKQMLIQVYKGNNCLQYQVMEYNNTVGVYKKLIDQELSKQIFRYFRNKILKV